MNFRVGQKVVCVDASEKNGRWFADAPIEGRVYTIVGFAETKRGTGLLLQEIANDEEFCGSYSPNRFRPIVERKTDISIFTAMLNPSHEKVRA